MLEDSRQDILNNIDKKKSEIKKYRETILSLTEKEKAESDSLKKWMYRLWCRHQKNAIEARQEDLKDLALNLEVTNAAIASQKRDTALIEANEHLPLPGELSAQMAAEATGAPLLDKERPSGLSGFMDPLVSFGTSLFRAIRKEERAQGARSADSRPASPSSPSSSASSSRDAQ